MASDLQRLQDLRHQFSQEITVEELMATFPVSERKDAVGLLQRADRRGLGRFVLGRGSNKTRLIWKELQETPESAGEPDLEAASSRLARASLDYVFPLAEFNVQIRLPRDLSAAEAERIARFIASLAMP